jgi:hypothetical protein
LARPLFEIVPVERPGPEVALRVGGMPDLLPSDWPECETCGQTMAFRFELLHRPDALDLSPHGAVQIFQCEDREFRCRPDLPDGANDVLGVARASGWPARAHGTLRPAGEDSAALSIDLERASPEELRAYERAQDSAPKSKVGGAPIWLQGPQTPSCCGAPMEFIAQLDGDAWGLRFGDGGAGYVFRCVREAGRYAFLTQSY